MNFQGWEGNQNNHSKLLYSAGTIKPPKFVIFCSDNMQNYTGFVQKLTINYGFAWV